MKDKIILSSDLENYATKTYADGVKEDLNKSIGTVSSEISAARTVNDKTYSNLKAALAAVIEAGAESGFTRAKEYSDGRLSSYEAVSWEIVDNLTAEGHPDVASPSVSTFYLVPNKAGTGYDKYVWIKYTDEDENLAYKWDVFGSSTTIVVDSLDDITQPSEDVDYVVNNNDGCLYYKYINEQFIMVGGSTALFLDGSESESIEVFLDSVSANSFTDYYILFNDTYSHYRYYQDEWIAIGDTLNIKSEIEEIQRNVSNMNVSIANLLTDVATNGNNISDIQDILNNMRDGHEYMIRFDQNTNVLSLYCDGVIQDQVTLPAGGGGVAAGSTVSIEKVTATPVTMLLGDDCELYYNFSSLDTTGDATGDCTADWYVSNIKVATETVSQGVCKFNVGKHLASGSNNVRLRITDSNGAIGTTTWVVRAINMYMSSTFDDKLTYSSDVTFRFTPFGSGIEKTAHIYLDDELYFTGQYTSSGVAQSLIIPKEDLGHGSHSLRVYCTATVNDVSITSDILYFDIMYVDSEETAPVIGCAYDGSNGEQYSALTLEYFVYNPASQTADVDISVYSVAEDETRTLDSTSTVTVDRTTHSWSYKPTSYGDKVIVFSCGATTKEILISIDKFPYDISEVSGKAFDFNPTGRTNNDANFTSYSNNGYTMSVSDNFDWTNGGWKTDADGNSYFCVKAGTTMSLNYPLFYPIDDDDIKQTGMNFKLIYKATNCRDLEAEVMSCMSGNIGMKMTATNSYLHTGSASEKVKVPYCDDTYMEFEWNITPDENSGGFAEIFCLLDGDYTQPKIYSATDSFMQSTQAPITFGSENCDVWIYRMKAYRTHLADADLIANYIADAPDATEMADRYNKNNILNDDGELDYTKINAILPDLRVILIDCPRFTTGKKDSVTALKDTEGNVLYDCSVQHIYPAGGAAHNWTASGITLKGQGTSSEQYGASSRNMDIKCSNGFVFNDGTTSDTYAMTENSIGVNYFNIKVNVASSENANNACLADDYNTFQPYIRAARLANSKVRDTMEFHPCVIFVRESNPDISTHKEFADTNYHFYSCGDFGNSKKNHAAMGMDKTNPNECIVEIANNTDRICLFKHDGTSFKANGLADYNTIFDWEGWGDATEAQMKEGWHNSVEFRYPEDFGLTDKDGKVWTEDEHKTSLIEKFKRFYTFVASTDTAAATNAALEESVTYGETTYTTDSAEYRKAKFINEFEDYMVKDSVLYHYLFTERHTMVDNRAKNTFWHTSDGVHWDLVFDYDNDTADGNNNEGNLVLSFGMEDIDKIGDGNVYNGASIIGDADSCTLWANVRENMYDDLAELFRTLESKGAWDSTRILNKFNNYQSVKCRRLQMFDARRKYIRPYETPNTLGGHEKTSAYFAMMYGLKELQRTLFEKYQEKYCSSKYSGSTATGSSAAITVRSYSGGVLEIIPYASVYVGIQAGSTKITQRATRGEKVTIDLTNLTLNDTETYIYSASLIQKINGLASLHIGYANFSPAIKLTELYIGSPEDGYTNTSFGSSEAGNGIDVSANTLLEVLDLRNCASFNSALDLSNCQALREVYTTGTQCSGITFATGGMVEKAELNDIGALIARNLTKLYYGNSDKADTLTFEGNNNLKQLIVENTDNVYKASLAAYTDKACISTLALYQDCENIERLRLTNVYWTLNEDTDVILDEIMLLSGFSTAGYNQTKSVLTGYVFVPTLKQSKETEYKNIWGDDLTIDYSTYVEQHEIKFLDDDGETVLYTEWVDAGSSVINPKKYFEDYTTPTKTMDARYTYAFKNWKDVSSDVTFTENADTFATNVGASITYMAQYTATEREFTVTWVNGFGDTLKTATVTYGSEAVWDFMPSADGIPTYTGVESSLRFYLFKGWNKSTGYVTNDMTVTALWDLASNAPAVRNANDTQYLNNASWVDLYRICAGYPLAINSYIYGGDRKVFKMGNDYSFENVPELDIISESTYFDGSTAYEATDENGNTIDLFGDNDKSFTMCLDYEYTATNSTSTIMSVCDTVNNSIPLRLQYSAGHRLDFGSAYTVAGYSTYRNMIVIRHIKGEDRLYVYSFNPMPTPSSGNPAFRDAKSIITLTNSSISSGKLVLGGAELSTGFGAYGKGFIHKCKIWYADLGDYVAQSICDWTTENVVIKAASLDGDVTGRYALSDNALKTSSVSFMFEGLLMYAHRMNVGNYNYSTSGGKASDGYYLYSGWHDTQMRKFLNPKHSDCTNETYTVGSSEAYTGEMGRFYKGLPVQLRALIKRVKTYANIGNATGNSSTTPVRSDDDYIYLPCLYEVGGTSGEPYIREGYYKNTLVANSNIYRAKYFGRVVPEDATYYSNTAVTGAITCSADPTTLYEVKTGDVWQNGTAVYVYEDADICEKFSRTADGTLFVEADDGGLWVRASIWWERSPYATGTNAFYSVGTTGNSSNGYGASYANGVCPCFSIGA